jgi:dihydrofolate reductase
MIAFVLAMDVNGLIGKDNGLPWHLPADLKYFKKLTIGHPVVMGRKTHESIGRPLPGRRNVVLTRQTDYEARGCEVYHAAEDILKRARGASIWFVIGGLQVFQAFEPFADRMYITLIEHAFDGDTHFTFDRDAWRLVSDVPGRVDEKNRWPHRFQIYERRKR